MKLTFFGGAKTVTGANYLLQAGETKVLIDCGLFQGDPVLVAINQEEFSFDPKKISHVFITHSHQDHCGRIPKLVASGFGGQIVATPPAIEMMILSLEDSSRLIAQEAEESAVALLIAAAKTWYLARNPAIGGIPASDSRNIAIAAAASGEVLDKPR